MKKYSVMLAVLSVAGLLHADVVTTYMKPTSAWMVSGSLDASVDTAVFEWSANNATIQMTLRSTGGNLWSDGLLVLGTTVLTTRRALKFRLLLLRIVGISWMR